MPPEAWWKRGFFVVFLSFAEIGVSHCSPGWSGTHCGGHVSLELVAMPLASLPEVETAGVSPHTQLEGSSRGSHTHHKSLVTLLLFKQLGWLSERLHVLTSLSYCCVRACMCLFADSPQPRHRARHASRPEKACVTPRSVEFSWLH